MLPIWVAPIDRKQGNIYLPILEAFNQTIIWNAIATVIDGPVTDSNDETDATVIAILMLLE